MLVREVLARRGGIASRADLVVATSRAAVDRSLREGDIVALARGRYALSALDNAATAAHRVGGVLCLSSAAAHLGWEIKAVPEVPHVAVGRGRRLPDCTRVQLHRHDLHPDQVAGICTSAGTTLEMCMRTLPFDEALSVADSFLRHGGHLGMLRGIAASARGPGAPQICRVAREANGDAANPFESVLRAIALAVTGLNVRPQVVISGPTVWARPDLVDEDLQIVLEADSFAWHGDRAALHRDANRYNRLVAAGWRVLRFSWEQVMFHPDDVAAVLHQVVHGHTEVGSRSRQAG